jgi:hypothetical protein
MQRSKRLHTENNVENNVGAGLSEDFAKIQKHQIKTRPLQPKLSANHPIQRSPKIH